jgi:phosphoribosyl-AMP cyclohydrolase
MSVPTPHPPPPIPDLNWDADGLVPVVTQDAATGAVLILAFMNQAALAATLATGQVHFWSRSRQRLWRKGETSGHILELESLYVNCEENSLLLKVRPHGPACHTGYPTCFYRRVAPDGSLIPEGAPAFDPATVYGVKRDA